MPLFSSTTPFDGDVEKATSEMNTTEDWSVILDICDKVGRTPNGAKDCLKSIVKRLNHRIPHVSMQACTLLDACANNCGREFHLEIASRDFSSECRTLIGGKAHPKVAAQLKQLIKKWAENDFKSDPALDMIPSLYSSLIKDGVDFSPSTESGKSTQNSTPAPKDPNVVSSQQEEDDIAKAIALSLEEEKKKGGKSSSSSGSGSSSLYPTFNSSPSTSNSGGGASAKKELRKVRALYDFEAAEDNELTFKAGEIIGILDDSDANWWKGSTWRGEGLFPANFCTADLSVEVEPEVTKEKKSVQFNEEVEVNEVEPIPEQAEIDENKIDECLAMLQNADPTGETNPDQPEMLVLEEQCKAQGPLIDTELEKIDRKHNDLMDLNTKVMDALQMYHNLMKELPAYGYGGVGGGKMPPQPQFGMQQPPPQMYNGQMPPQMPPGGVPPPHMQPPPPTQPHSFTPTPPGTQTTTSQYSGVATTATNGAPHSTGPAFMGTGPPPPTSMYNTGPQPPLHQQQPDVQNMAPQYPQVPDQAMVYSMQQPVMHPPAPQQAHFPQQQQPLL